MEKDLSASQQQPISLGNCKARISLEKKLDNLHAKHEGYWYLRSRVTEVRHGDKNTKYFHHKASQRKKRNYVKGLYNDNESWRDDMDGIECIFTSDFDSIFTSTNPSDLQLHTI